MKITHQHKKNSINGDSENSVVSFLLSNKIGGFFSQSQKDNISRYQGLYYLRKRHNLVKTVDSFNINKKLSKIKNNMYDVERIYDKTIERFTFINNSDSLVYELENYTGLLNIKLDCREMYDFDDKGREYNIEVHGDMVVVKYAKRTNKRYNAFVVIKGASDVKIKNKYVEQQYPFDKQRGTNPSSFWVLEGLNINVDKGARLVITSGDDLGKIKYEADHIYSDLDSKLLINKDQTLKELHTDLKINDPDLIFAYLNSINSLNELTCVVEGKKGIYAGLWWFFHWWGRDEAISSKALMLQGKYLYVKEMLMRQIDIVLEDGRVPNIYPSEGLSSADGVGWSFKRLKDLITMLKQKKLDHMYFNDVDYVKILAKLEQSIEGHVKTYRDNGFFKSGYNETWMDTAGEQRNGCRVEIQALILSMYDFAVYLSDMLHHKDKAKKYKELHDAFRKHIREFFFSGFELADGIKDKVVDFTPRPNLFLAYYVAPQLLSNKEWDKVFSNVLDHILIEWGFDKAAVSSIDKDAPNFIDEYSGENNISYHYGDVWYFINNIAALCLYRVNYGKYVEVIQKILQSSTQEILWKGIVGHAAEISSAKEFRSEASLSQAWSSATYIELIQEIYSNFK